MLHMLTTDQSLVVELRPNFKTDNALLDQIFEVTGPSYVSTFDLLAREIHHNRDIYIIQEQNSNRLLAYFMINYEKVGDLDTCYLGLSACRNSHKGRGFVKTLYQKLVDDCKLTEQATGRRILLWWTTATPVVYHWFNNHIAGVQPDMNGDFDQEGARLVRQIIAEKYPDVQVDPYHPFILRSAATNTNYSEQEQQRLQQIAKALHVDVFEKFGVSEANGDRFLMFGYTPV